MTLSSSRLVATVLFVLLFPGGAAGQKFSETALPGECFRGFAGAFVLYDMNADAYAEYHPAACKVRLSPASTFKIPNSLIGLETGVIRDEHFVIPWDSVARSFPSWNRDHDLSSAIANSVVWYYQELARRVGEKRMREAVAAIGYGNGDISGGIDHFWLGSTLKISAEEQVGFLRRLYSGDLPFSTRSMEIVKKILILEKNDSLTLRGKTGCATQEDGTVVGWFVGYVEKGKNVYFFASNITSNNAQRDGDIIFNARKEVALAVLRKLGIL